MSHTETRQLRSTAADSPPVLSVAPLRLPAPHRGEDLQFRVSAPLSGDALPILIFSHGNGQSLYGYGPLVNHWAASGFTVINPTHLDSRMLAMAADDARRPQLWRLREQDLLRLLDGLDTIEDSVPWLRGRLDRSRIAVAGHSWGAQTASMLLGARHPDPDDGATIDITDPRVKAGVLLAVPGTGGANLSPFAAQNFPFMHPDFSGLRTATLVVAGADDHGAMNLRGPAWWREAYDLSPGARALFTIRGAGHSLGGIPGYEAKETTDESEPRIAAVQRLSTAFLRNALYSDQPGWRQAVNEIVSAEDPLGTLETK